MQVMINRAREKETDRERERERDTGINTQREIEEISLVLGNDQRLTIRSRI